MSTPHTAPYSLSLLRAARRGASYADVLTVTATIPPRRTGGTPRQVYGPIIGIGSRISVRDHDTGLLVEDIRDAWVTCATVESVHQQ